MTESRDTHHALHSVSVFVYRGGNSKLGEYDVPTPGHASARPTLGPGCGGRFYIQPRERGLARQLEPNRGAIILVLAGQ